MTHKSLKIVLCFYMVFSNFYGFAQLGFSENKIVESQGKYFKKEVTETSILLYYNSSLIDDYGKSSPQVILYVVDRDTNKCFLEVYNCSKSAINTYYKTLNKMAVKLDEHTWKNYNNNSIYVLKVDGNILNIEHTYAPLNSSSSASNTNSTILSLQNELYACKNENQNLSDTINGLSATVNGLKQHIQYLINSSKDISILTTKGAENIEKALESIKQKDLKITMLQEALTKKDSVMLEYIKVLKMKSDKK